MLNPNVFSLCLISGHCRHVKKMLSYYEMGSHIHLFNYLDFSTHAVVSRNSKFIKTVGVIMRQPLLPASMRLLHIVCAVSWGLARSRKLNSANKNYYIYRYHTLLTSEVKVIKMELTIKPHQRSSKLEDFKITVSTILIAVKIFTYHLPYLLFEPSTF